MGTRPSRLASRHDSDHYSSDHSYYHYHYHYGLRVRGSTTQTTDLSQNVWMTFSVFSIVDMFTNVLYKSLDHYPWLWCRQTVRYRQTVRCRQTVRLRYRLSVTVSANGTVVSSSSSRTVVEKYLKIKINSGRAEKQMKNTSIRKVGEK